MSDPIPTHSGPPWSYRVKFLGFPLAMAAFCGWFASCLIWPFWAGIGTLIALFTVITYLALFIWSIEGWKER